ncbi:hemagglutinin [Mycoplasmopsis synoviae]|uniref:hemagglutinin n=1 Tax=Mycoplasmopsis synoviae TaxID=2109 RepID=UPI00387A91BF
MPKIVVDGYVADGAGANKAQHETENTRLLQQWFDTPANWEKLSEQLTKKLGSSKFKNIVLTSPMVSYEDTSSNTRVPKVTFTLRGKEGYNLQTDNGATSSLTLSIRVLYTSAESTQNVLQMQGASSSATPGNTRTVSDTNVLRNVNVYLNYTGPVILLDADLPAVGTANNTTINGTSKIEGNDLATKVKALLNKTANQNDPTDLMKAITKYVQTIDPKYLTSVPASAGNSRYRAWVSWLKTEGVVLKQSELKYPGDVFLQQMHMDSEAVYLPIGGFTDDQWLNTFLIRIPLTKFVRPLTEFQAQSEAAPTEETSGEQDLAPTGTGS